MPGATTSRASRSESTSTAPRSTSRAATVDLPDPMPPVSPTRSTRPPYRRPISRWPAPVRAARWVRRAARAPRPASSAAPAARGRRACAAGVLPAAADGRQDERDGAGAVLDGEHRLLRPLDEHPGRATDRRVAVRAVLARGVEHPLRTGGGGRRVGGGVDREQPLAAVRARRCGAGVGAVHALEAADRRRGHADGGAHDDAVQRQPEHRDELVDGEDPRAVVGTRRRVAGHRGGGGRRTELGLGERRQARAGRRSAPTAREQSEDCADHRARDPRSPAHRSNPRGHPNRSGTRRAAKYMTNGPPVACCATSGPFLSSGGGSGAAGQLLPQRGELLVTGERATGLGGAPSPCDE